MNGQLSENPLAELIRELALKNLSGRLRLRREKVTVVIYFDSGLLLYAACNLPALRFRTYLLRHRLVTEDELLHLGKRTKDFDLARLLISEKRISPAQAKQIQLKQVSDTLRLVLLWMDGSWEFDHSARLNEEVDFEVKVPELLVETSRRLAPNFTSSRFRNPTELFAHVLEPPNVSNLLPVEGFLLSRIDSPIVLSDLILVSGLDEAEVQRIVYTLTLVDLLKREYWKSAFRDLPAQPTRPIKKVEAAPVAPPPSVVEIVDTPEVFISRMSSANTHYEVLDVTPNTRMAGLKNAYYDIARKYHPDRFKSSAASLLTEIESAFARVTQAYETLRDPGLRATYDSKLDAQSRAERLAQKAPRSAKQSEEREAMASDRAGEEALTPVQRAEAQFKEGFAALELGQRNIALGLLGSAARTVPDEPRYRAYFGKTLALHASTRRLAEAELQAAVKLDPSNAEYRIMLAELYRDLGFIVRARSEAERAIASDQNNRRAQDLLRSLD